MCVCDCRCGCAHVKYDTLHALHPKQNSYEKWELQQDVCLRKHTSFVVSLLFLRLNLGWMRHTVSSVVLVVCEVMSTRSSLACSETMVDLNKVILECYFTTK
jgi:hypothetical protein